MFYAEGVRFERGSRGGAACAHRPQKCSRLVSAPPLSEALHYSHISGGSPKIAMTELGRSLLFFCVRRDTEIRTGFARRSRLRAPPSKVLSPRLRTAPPHGLCTTRIAQTALFAHPAVIDLPAINAGDADPAAARPGMHPRANAFPTTPARRTTLVKFRL